MKNHQNKEFKYVFLPSWIAALLIVSLSLLNLIELNFYILIFFTVVGALIGIPHGAIDHFIPFDLTHQRVKIFPMTIILIVYIGLFFSNVFLWFVKKEIAFLTFILITLFHFGQTEFYSLKRFLRLSYFKNEFLSFFTIFIKGSIPLFIPLIFYPQGFAKLFNEFSMESYFKSFEKNIEAFSLIYFSLIAAYILLNLFLALNERMQLTFIQDCFETFILIALFILVKPILSISFYLFFWHSLRHLMRLFLINDEFRQALEKNGFFKTHCKYLYKALPTLSLAMLFLFFLYPLFPDFQKHPLQIFLIFISSLTLPHTVLVSWMDFYERVYDK